jgi:hypothetical protein
LSSISREYGARSLDLSDEETAALAQLLRRTINEDPYPLSPRLAPLERLFVTWRVSASALRGSAAEARAEAAPSPLVLFIAAAILPANGGGPGIGKHQETPQLQLQY